MSKLYKVTRLVTLSCYVLAEDEEDSIQLAQLFSSEETVEEKIGELVSQEVENVPFEDMNKNLVSRDKVIRTLEEYSVLETKPMRFSSEVPKVEKKNG